MEGLGRAWSEENGGIKKEHPYLTATPVLPKDIWEGKSFYLSKQKDKNDRESLQTIDTQNLNTATALNALLSIVHNKFSPYQNQEHVKVLQKLLA